ncbi:helix-turn-helix transcriptional regulator [Aliarcobacter cryaerophilus]|uniref:helix-turn-helix transcriptional regulator n=1 Tax=Aliarcobacter cryaerophilus TaxID=28198 RepID=UPI003DA55BC9
MEKDKFLRINDVLKQIPVSRATLYRLSKQIKLLRPIKVGGSSFWSQNNINTYFEDLKNDNLAA